ncbi:Uncharacterised protein [Mycobacterium tuberculosis]|nr:Uncharacterised protein [Mycobacterium tuberculosis]
MVCSFTRSTRVLTGVSNRSPRDTSRSLAASRSSISASPDNVLSGAASALSSSTPKCRSICLARAGSRISTRCSASTSTPARSNSTMKPNGSCVMLLRRS